MSTVLLGKEGLLVHISRQSRSETVPYLLCKVVGINLSSSGNVVANNCE